MGQPRGRQSHADDTGGEYKIPACFLAQLPYFHSLHCQSLPVTLDCNNQSYVLWLKWLVWCVIVQFATSRIAAMTLLGIGQGLGMVGFGLFVGIRIMAINRKAEPVESQRGHPSIINAPSIRRVALVVVALGLPPSF